jgi:hypothetical protein
MSDFRENLKTKVELVLAQRKISQKELIFECSCSRSHFNKVINGERKAGTALQKRMTNVLSLTEQETNLFFNYEKQLVEESCKVEPDTIINSEWHSFKSCVERVKVNNKLLFIMLLMILATAVLFYKGFFSNVSPNSYHTFKPLKNDWSSFVKDISVPDGSMLKVNSHYIKTWRIKNTGEHVWRGRYLKRLTPHSNLLCSSPSMVPIERTNPGEFVDISIKFKTPHMPGSCRLDFKMSDKFGNLYFPKLHGVYLLVYVKNN